MEVIKRFFLFVMLLVCSSVNGQDESLIIREGLFRTQATLSPSYMFSNKQSFFYIHGNFEGYLSAKLSLAGEGYSYLGTYSSDSSTFDFNHSLFFGLSKHFTRGNHDVYVGIQPGISFVKLNAWQNKLTTTKTGVSPVFSSVLGYNFYVNHFIHFFIQTRILMAEHHYDIAQNISELRVSAGLGFNLNAIN